MRKVYASIWYHPEGKWKLEEAIIVEDEKIVDEAAGGTFYFGDENEDEETLKSALLDLLFYQPEDFEEEENWEKSFEEIKEETEVEFVSSEELERLKQEFEYQPLGEGEEEEDYFEEE